MVEEEVLAAGVVAASVEAAAVSAAGELREVGKMINAETFFSAEEQERIRQAVIDAERGTAGEIVPMLVTASGRYAEVEIAGLVIGLLIGTLAELILHDPWASIHSQLLWPLVGAMLGFIACSLPPIKRWMLSKDQVAEAVHLRSLAAFTAHGLHYTREHTGILILASLLEHRVEVLADKGINEKVPAGTWDEVVQILTNGLKSGYAFDAFCKAIERCGEILAQHFPRPPDDQDELANKLVTER
jgi:putative membrane protein